MGLNPSVLLRNVWNRDRKEPAAERELRDIDIALERLPKLSGAATPGTRAERIVVLQENLLYHAQVREAIEKELRHYVKENLTLRIAVDKMLHEREPNDVA